jgi:hypothetical protein
MIGPFHENQTVPSTMSSPNFMIFIFQVDSHKVKVFPKFQFFIVTISGSV